jgi:hypothetical protein
VRGVVRPCRHQLAPELFREWTAHLCGLCLTLQDGSGQASRLLTGYDALLLSVLVEAQTGVSERRRWRGRRVLRLLLLTGRPAGPD